MTGTTQISGVTVTCDCISLRQLRIGPNVVETVYSLIVAGVPVSNNNFTEDEK